MLQPLYNPLLNAWRRLWSVFDLLARCRTTPLTLDLSQVGTESAPENLYESQQHISLHSCLQDSEPYGSPPVSYGLNASRDWTYGEVSPPLALWADEVDISSLESSVYGGGEFVSNMVPSPARAGYSPLY